MADKFQAVCDIRRPPHLLAPWFGPERNDFATAQKDADDHNLIPDHDAAVMDA